MTHAAALPMADTHAPPNLLTHLLRLIGRLTDPKTATGRAFVAGERASTWLMGKLATSDRYLRLAGRGLEAGFVLRRNMIDAAEEMLHALRVPALSEISDLRRQVRALGDRLEVTQAQLEVALELLERMERRAAGAAAQAAQAAQAGEEVA